MSKRLTELLAHTFSCTWQQDPILYQQKEENDHRYDFVINLHESVELDRHQTGIQLATPGSAARLITETCDKKYIFYALIRRKNHRSSSLKQLRMGLIKSVHIQRKSHNVVKAFFRIKKGFLIKERICSL